MAITRQQKEEILAALTEEFKSAGSVGFTTYTGATVNDMQELRNQLRESDVRLIVAKKTLIQKAAEAAGMKEIPAESMEGPIAAIFSHGDELAGLQVVQKFAKDHEQFGLTGGVFDGETLDANKAKTLANLPGREALIGQIVGLLAAPMRGAAGIGNSLLAGLTRVIDGRREKLEKEG